MSGRCRWREIVDSVIRSGIQPARLHQASDFPCGFRDFGAATVVDAVIDRDDFVVRRHGLRDRQLIDDTAPQAWP